VVFSQDGHHVASQGYDGTIYVWNTTGDHRLTLLPSLVPGIPADVPFYFGPDHRQFLITYDRKHLWAWDINGHSTLRDLIPADRVLFTRGGTGVAVSINHDQIKLKRLGPAPKPLGSVSSTTPETLTSSLVLSQDGQRLAGTNGDGTIGIWNLSNISHPIQLPYDTPLIEPRPLGNVIQARLAFSPEGQWLASSHLDGLRIWKTDAVAMPVVFGNYGAPIQRATFSPDGQYIATSQIDGTIRLWPCEVCGPISKILALANQRVTRTLTSEERRLFLNH
jgi:WD40 repeat protein